MERSRTGSLGTGENSAKSCGKGRYGKADNEGTVRGVEAKKGPLVRQTLTFRKLCTGRPRLALSLLEQNRQWRKRDESAAEI